MPRYRTINNDTAINVDGVRVFADADGAFTAESGSRLEQVLLAWGAIQINSRGLAFDKNGNLIVTGIVPRKDTLANLLLLTGSQGEIAVATDVAAMVKYTGSAPPNNAQVFRKSDVMGTVSLSLDVDTTVNSGAETNILLGRVVRDDFGASTDGKIHVPTDAAFFDLSLLVFWPDASAGTYRTAILRGTTGVGLNLCSDTFAPNAGNAARPSLLNLLKPDLAMFGITPGTTVLQPRLKHDSGSAQVFAGYSGSVSPGTPSISMSATFYA